MHTRIHPQLILSKSEFTLEELLEEEELIQECKSLNGRLINLYVLHCTQDSSRTFGFVAREGGFVCGVVSGD